MVDIRKLHISYQWLPVTEIISNLIILRYNIVVFGGIDGFSRKVQLNIIFKLNYWFTCYYIFSFAWNLTFSISILNQVLYLNAAGNNKAETGLRFLLESVQKHGWPSR